MLDQEQRKQILDRMEQIEGWYSREEGELLLSGVEHALLARWLGQNELIYAVVELGSYCGRSTSVLASAVRLLGPRSFVWSIDPHDGRIADDEYYTPSRDRFNINISDSGLNGFVAAIQKRSTDINWSRAPISLLHIDALHDYASVKADFEHFEPYILIGGLIAFHDYCPLFPGVIKFVDELLLDSKYQTFGAAGSLIVVEKASA